MRREPIVLCLLCTASLAACDPGEAAAPSSLATRTGALTGADETAPEGSAVASELQAPSRGDAVPLDAQRVPEPAPAQMRPPTVYTLADLDALKAADPVLDAAARGVHPIDPRGLVPARVLERTDSEPPPSNALEDAALGRGSNADALARSAAAPTFARPDVPLVREAPSPFRNSVRVRGASRASRTRSGRNRGESATQSARGAVAPI